MATSRKAKPAPRQRKPKVSIETTVVVQLTVTVTTTKDEHYVAPFIAKAIEAWTKHQSVQTGTQDAREFSEVELEPGVRMQFQATRRTEL